MDELVGWLFVVGLVIAAIVWVVKMILLLLLYTFLLSAATVGHPLILLLLVMGIMALARASGASFSNSPRGELFGMVLSVRAWTQIATAIFLAVIGLYGVLVL